MTESEAQKWLERFEWDDSEETSDALATICEALQEYPKFKAIGTVEELQKMKADYAEAIIDWRQYKKIGTIERFRELTEKAEPKKVIGIEAKLLGRYCPICCEVFSELEIKKRIKWCPKCNQRLDWE